MKKKVFTYTLFPILIGFLFFLYSFSSSRNGRKNVKEIVVEFEVGNNNFLTHETVNKLLIQNGARVKNQPKSSVDLQYLEEVVLANPYVEEATVFLTLDGGLKTQIKQRKPIARIISGKEVYYIDKYGVKMPLSTNFSARVPLVYGVKSSEEIKKITRLITFISNNDFLKKEITGVYKNNNGDYLLTVRSGDYKINLGEVSELDVKFKKLKAFYNKALLDGSINKYKTITVKYSNQVVCTKQNQDGKQ